MGGKDLLFRGYKNGIRMSGFREDWGFSVYEGEKEKFGDLEWFDTFQKL